MAMKTETFCLFTLLVLIPYSHGLFFGPVLDFFVGNLGNDASLFSNSSALNNTIFSLVEQHIAHTAGSLASLADIAQLLAEQKLVKADFAAQYARNVSDAVGIALSNYTQAKFNLTNEAAQTVMNAGANLTSLFAETLVLKPALAADVAQAFAGSG